MASADERVYGGRYHLQRGIARGGMADVFLAHDQMLDRPVALKVLFPELSSDSSFVERFRREAQSAANLSHPNIVNVFDWGEEDGTYFIVMEHVDGQPLSEIIRQEGPLHADRAADIGAEIAAALSSAHRSGMIHRDVKPSNVLVPPDGHVKVTDFGIARAITASEGLTQTGAVMGTASYFSPEQAQGHALDPRSDLYSLGVVLYEMVTGRAPFTGDSPVSIAYKHVRENPTPVGDINPDVPDDFERIIHKAMAKDAANRYQSATDLAADLQRFRDGQRVAAGPVATAGPEPGTTSAMADYDATTALGPVGPPTTAQPPVAGGGGNRSGAYIAVLVGLLAVLGVLIFALVQVLDDGGSNGVAQVTVPSVLSLTSEDARTELESLGLVVIDSFETNEEVEANIVFGQVPEAGAIIDEGDEVTIRVSEGEAPVELRSVVGLSYDDAVDVIVGLGLVPSRDDQPHESAPEGEVTAQSPPAGDEVPRGATITLTVSSGKPEVEIPSTAGKSPVEAANILGQAGFDTVQGSEPSDTVPSGTVIGTDPSAGTTAPHGSTVTIIVSSGPEQVAVPNVVGDDEATARTKLESAGFVVAVDEQSSGPSDDGKVLSQNPAGGSTAAKGSTVTIVVGRFLGPGPTTTTAGE
ncbi:MAG TPA: Stk1 family PASTA domain-containing Ser/Thr kinase [Acidimicrobiales bacterium]